MTRAIIIGGSGNVGRAIASGCLAEGWAVETVQYPALPSVTGAVVFDCGPAGVDGYDNPQWGSYFTAVERAVALVRLCEDQQAACLFLCSSPFAEWEPDRPYGASKLLIEALARAQNAHGRCPVVVDRIGMQNEAAPTLRKARKPYTIISEQRRNDQTKWVERKRRSFRWLWLAKLFEADVHSDCALGLGLIYYFHYFRSRLEIDPSVDPAKRREKAVHNRPGELAERVISAIRNKLTN